MTDLIYVTQLVDPDDTVLGFVTSQVDALSRRFDRVVVVANEVRRVPDGFGAEVVTLGKEAGAGPLRRGLRYERALVDLTRHLDCPVVFAHMCPSYLTLAAPIAHATRTPTVLWYTHPAESGRLRRAERRADAILTAVPGSFPRTSDKVRCIGHAIDLQRFPFTQVDRTDAPLRLVALGRTASVKGYHVMIDAVSSARQQGVDVRLAIYGTSSTPDERRHRQDLLRQIDERGLQSVVGLRDAVAHQEIAGVLREAHALVNATTSGSADKAVFEAMACGRAALVSNTALTPLLSGSPIPLAFTPGDAGALAARIVELASTSASTLRETGRVLRAIVERDHSLDHWVDEVAGTAESLRRPPPPVPVRTQKQPVL